MGLMWSIAFVVVGVDNQLQMYGDGSIFSYAVAVRDAWAFHWHNIAARVSVYLLTYIPAETYVALTRDPEGGVALFGFLFFAAPFLGLVATFAADRSKRRTLFAYACGSTACLAPLVFGFPTEVWMAHTLFWPTLALCHHARRGFAGGALVFSTLLALTFTHTGALIFVFAILITLLPRGLDDAIVRRTTRAVLAILTIWLIVKIAVPPDDYVADVLKRAALHVFDPSILTGYLMELLSVTLAVYAFAYYLGRSLNPMWAHWYAALAVAAALGVYWLYFDSELHAENRYYLRTVILLATPAFGALAVCQTMDAGRHGLAVPLLPDILSMLTRKTSVRAITGAFLLITMVHVVETAKFVDVWTHYTDAVRRLAMSGLSDPALGDPRFVSSRRIGDDLNRVSWFSTTQFLSVLLAPHLKPMRLVMDPSQNYFWLSCRTATANADAARVVPVETRRLVQRDSCLHR